ncbi:uncharacterized protein [Argopecten irradians]|uniref:uncharacterized protein n=1 Tax=Argopecten irradians TaxID=31199 RepID=UPI0037165170
MASSQISEVLQESRETLFMEDPSNRLNKIFDLVQSIDTRLQRLEPIEQMITGVQSSLNSLTLKVNSLEGEISNLKEKNIEMEVSCRAISDMFDQIKVTTDKHSKELQGLRHTVSTPCKADNKVQVLQKSLDTLQAKNDVLVNSVTELKWRSMKNNLVFSGLREEDGEDTEAVLREFLSVELGISRVELGNVHRFGKFIRGKHRHIVARFLYNRERSNVLGNSRKLSGTTFYINEQFPTEIEEKRRVLYPKLKELRREGHRVKLVRDKLIVDGHLYTEDVVTEDKPREAPNGRITVNEVNATGAS